jgi:hypothetical protein
VAEVVEVIHQELHQEQADQEEVEQEVLQVVLQEQQEQLILEEEVGDKLVVMLQQAVAEPAVRESLS